jgi:hypothetical protein
MAEREAIQEILLAEYIEKLQVQKIKLDKLQGQYDALKKDMADIKAACLSTVLAASDSYRRACNCLNAIQHNRAILALQYRDFLFMYSRMFKTELQLNYQVLADVRFIVGSYPLLIGPG